MVLPEERRRKILEYIQINRSAKNEDLAAALGVSLATVRRDLEILENKGLVTRTHGGAVPPESDSAFPLPGPAFELLYSEKRLLHLEVKRRIGVAAAQTVADAETIILDTGSTTFEIARNLTRHKHLTIITNDLLIATSIEYDLSTTLVVSGGTRRAGVSFLLGPVAEDFFRGVRVNKTFLSADAVDPVHGISNASFSSAAAKQLMIKAAHEVALVVDHSKFGEVALAKVAGVDEVHQIITDSGVSGEVCQRLERTGLKVTAV
jgi:DeoR/GlpR family transcriptional regulator of sugar metabolism